MPFPKLTCCLDQPMCPEMVVIQKEIYRNPAPISLPFGTSHTRFLGIMMPEVLYIQHFNVLFQPPCNLGKYPDNIPTNASNQQCSKLLICHKASKLVYNTFKVVLQCLWNQFQEAIHKDYVAELNYPDIGLNNVFPSIIYQHIVNRYAKIDLRMAEENQKKFNAPIDPSKPLAVYTKKQKHCQAFAADAGSPISMADMMQTGVTHVVATRVMHDA